ncbi:GNAT family N-acetyltransferase [Streptomyces sp. NPDC102441]|uniref:GNAT family N-acetyltransferase n=1 Tax=Streptomyces sp. NPDC102441 TaxID=3366176 RepID=UPI0037F80A2C
MTTVAPRSVPLPYGPGVTAPRLRPARERDAPALADLARPFVRSGALRERPPALYADHAADFLVAEATGGSLEGCVGLRVYPADEGEGPGPTGVLYNFCVAGHSQGRGVGAGLLGAVLTRSRARSLRALFTATTGDGGLFLRYGFTPAAGRPAPRAWAKTLDPRRNAHVLALTW